jgi:diacylglycerol kinase family enzyme
MKHVFVFDPKSFFSQQWKMDGILDHIGQFFRTQEKPDFSIQFSRYRRDAILLIQQEAEKAKPGDIVRIYAIGGEEILYDCVNGVAHFPNMQLAVVPYGESCDFLNLFGKNKAEAFRDLPSLIQSDALPTDLIKWGVNFALNSCYIGLNSAMAAKLREMKTKLGKGSFAVFSKIASFLNYAVTAMDREIASQEYTVSIDDKDFSGHYSLIHIANGPYHTGKMTGVTNAVPDDGLLDVALIKSADPLKTMWSMGRYAKGKRPSNSIVMQAKKITVRSEKQMWVQMDNEYFRDTNISINIIPQATQIVAVDNLTYPVTGISGA